jgi:hypothetical protein
MSIVSLGGSYIIVVNLKKYNLNHNSSPFDWCEINIKDLCNILETNFKYYENNSKRILANSNIEPYQLKLSNNILIKIKEFRELKNPVFIRFESNILNTAKINLYLKLEEILSKLFNTYHLILISRNKYPSSKVIWIKCNKNSKINWEEIFEYIKKNLI